MSVDAFGPKCFVIISMHIKESQEIRMPPSRAIQSSLRSVLFARRFMQMTLTTNNVTTVVGIALNSNLYSVIFFFILFFIFSEVMTIPTPFDLISYTCNITHVTSHTCDDEILLFKKAAALPRRLFLGANP